MSSKKVFDAMEAGEWQYVNEITTFPFTREDLEEKHGVLYNKICFT
jgi:hypothetical protein